jgi:AcrR family transcriptional regulator
MGRIAGVTAEETRGRLIAAAAEVFAEQGYEGARVGDIARRAGLTTGAIYAHYRTKGELLAEAVRARAGTELTALLAGTLKGPDAASITDLLQSLGSLLARPRRGRGGSLLVESVVAARRDPEVARLLHRRVGEREGVFADLIRQAQAAGALDPALPADAVARFCMTLALGSLVVRALGLKPPDAAEWDAVVSRLVAAVQPGERTP